MARSHIRIPKSVTAYVKSLDGTDACLNKREAKAIAEQIYSLMHLQATGWLPMRKRRRSREDHDAEG
jgi:hypothetical protein